MRNFVVKHDFNRATIHRDRKNAYTRRRDFEDDLEPYENCNTSGDNNQSTSHVGEEGRKLGIFATITS